jgi:membrane associated rhomboid family serine protease
MDRAPAINLPPVVVWLGAALVAVHAARQFLSEAADDRLLLAFAFIPGRYGHLAALLPGGAAARFWSPVSYAFLHADVVHLLINLVWMASFGGALARRFGAARFLLLSLAAAAAGAGLQYAMDGGDAVLVIGASGAVSGMMAATARFAFAAGGPLAGGKGPASYRRPAEPLAATLANPRAVVFILVWFAINLLFGLVEGLVPGASGPIAWQVHLGGFFAGLALFRLLDPVRPHDLDRERLEESHPPDLR